MEIIKDYDVVVIGSGHAGSEAALATARTGINTVLLTMSLDSIAFLACNPSIGGTAKGHLVTEIDALGGEMGVNADKTTIQLRMLNLGKGPAVHSLRSQVDKIEYHTEMKKTLENQKNLYVRQAEAIKITEENGEVKGVLTSKGEFFACKKVIVATGVYLKSRIIIGDYAEEVGPNGFKGANHLTQSLIDLGLEIKRFKTGTPNRVHMDSIDTSKLEIQYGEDNIQTFSFLTKKQNKNKAVCYLTYTNENTHKIINDNIHLAPLYSGEIKGTGPRYCPSIEDKVKRFADKQRHQIFIEPEAMSTKEAYVQGLSTSMPVDIQKRILKSIVGFENVSIMRDAYAIEYDCINSLDLYPTLEYKNIKGLYFAGQVNGTSGYEEAAAQGLVAGINASLNLRGKEPLVLTRSDAYIGVLIDDLVTKGTNEPYRMMTSRAEYRLHLRQDNADLRLTQIGYSVGLATKARYNKLMQKIKKIEEAKLDLQKTISPINQKLIDLFLDKNEVPPKNGVTVDSIIKRSNITAFDVKEVLGMFEGFDSAVINQINIQTKYDGYIKRQLEQIESAKKQENMKLDEYFDYSLVKGLRIEAMQKLNKIKPLSLGQASRISGVSPADINVLIIYFKLKNR
ncbi:MAG: tRNA uridine-5-carboxymethylaminomethyl(34) synthesis enzyme MnmG [Clostridia bacterium]|nr:tRNA uridine-5-carboxymethylaminomethyl(34) synthesis enzyme MnmG [Clostridia bacterium]